MYANDKYCKRKIPVITLSPLIIGLSSNEFFVLDPVKFGRRKITPNMQAEGRTCSYLSSIPKHRIFVVHLPILGSIFQLQTTNSFILGLDLD